MIYKVTTRAINIRTGPGTDNQSTHTVNGGYLIKTCGPNQGGWSRVLTDTDKSGWISLDFCRHAGYLQKMDNIRAAYLHQDGVTNNKGSRRFSLSSDFGWYKMDWDGIIKLLNVEHSKRYQPKNGTTYCNVYAHDVAYLAGYYLPRVWWVDKLWTTIYNGVQYKELYGNTVREMSANALYNWLMHYGYLFGWQRIATETEAQDRVNQGAFGVVSAAHVNPKWPGHIGAILPETTEHKAEWFEGVCVKLLTSEAGMENHAAKAVGWYKWRRFKGQNGCFINVIEPGEVR